MTTSRGSRRSRPSARRPAGATPTCRRSTAEPASDLAVARELRALDAVGQAALLGELVEVGRQRDGRRAAQGGGRVGPDAVEQLVGRAQAVGERALELALAVEAVGEVLVELCGWVEHERARAGGATPA